MLTPSASCPCGRKRTYVECCLGRRDWEGILQGNRGHEAIRHLSARGKNIAFSNELGRILGLTGSPHELAWSDVKRAVTPSAVRAIHEAVATLWPDARDTERILYEQRGEHSALFVGTYNPKPLMRGVARHSLYSDVILVLDPFHHPASLRDEYNPIVRPEEHRTNTVVALRLWWLLLPWIEADLVRVIRSPADFNSDLALSAMEAARERHATIPELGRILEAEVEERINDFDEYREYLDLSVPNAEIERRIREADPKVSPEELEAVFANLEERRLRHPFFITPLDQQGGTGDLLSFGVGASYDIAKLLAGRTRAHLVTDQRYRWKEIELDRRESGIDEQRWSAFAKAFQNADLRFLNTADLRVAERLRSEERLSDLRLFFRRVWQSVSAADSFDEAVAVDLAAELDAHLKETEEEWRKINQDLFKWFSSEGVAAATAVATGHMNLLPAAMAFVAAAGATSGLWALKRSGFAQAHPASFFIGID